MGGKSHEFYSQSHNHNITDRQTRNQHGSSLS